MTLVNWDRPEKGIARDFAMENYGERYGVYLCMPSHSCIDLKRGLENGTLKRTDKIIAIDNKPENWERIERFLAKNFKHAYLFRGDVHKCPLAQIMAEQGYSPIRFVFLDLCGNMNGHISHWLYTNRECFTRDCRFGLTVAASTRKKTWDTIVYKTAIDMGYSDDVENLLFESQNNLTKDIVGVPIEVVSHRQKIKKNRAAEKTNVIRSIKAACNSFMMAFNNFDMTINMLYRYKEANGDGQKHTEMVFIDFRFNGVVEGDDIHLDVVKEFDKTASYANQILRYGRTPKKKRTKRGRVAYADRFNVTTPKDLHKAGIKAAITRLAKKEAPIMGKTIEERVHRITAGILAGLTKREQAA